MKAVTHLLKLCSCLQLAWQNAVSPQPETEMELKETRDKYRETCITLANYYVMADNAKEWKLALPYYRMSQQPVFKILTQSKLLWMKEGEGNRVTRIPPGLIHYMVEVILNPLPCEDVLEASLADLIIDLLGEYALQVCPCCFTRCQDVSSTDWFGNRSFVDNQFVNSAVSATARLLNEKPAAGIRSWQT